MDYSEKNLPFQKQPSYKEEANVKKEHIEIEEIDFGTAFIKGAKTTAKRMLFHFKAIAGGLTAQILKLFVPSTIDPFYGATFLCSYIGIVMLFPLRKNYFATSLGLLTTLLLVIVGMWPIALLFGGFMTMLLDLVEQKNENSGFWFTIPFSLLAISYANIQMPETIFSALPLWTYIILAILLAIGLIRPRALRHQANLLLMPSAEKKIYLANIAKQENMKLKAQKAAEEQKSYAIFARHIEVLRLIEEENKKLPDNLSTVIDQIGHQSISILNLMQADPRDVIAGGQFLNRYLPLIHQSIVRYSTIKSLHSDANLDEDIDHKTLVALTGMQQAFIQIRKELAENDVDDLHIDLKVMDQLIRSQGFEIK